MGKMLIISFKDNKDEKVFHEVVNLLKQYEFQPRKEIKYQSVLTFDDFVVDPQELSVKKNGRLLDFNYREFSLLYVLASNKGMVFKYDYLYEILWGDHYMQETNSSITSLVSGVRAKIEKDTKHPRYILTVRGIGYRFNASYSERT